MEPRINRHRNWLPRSTRERTANSSFTQMIRESYSNMEESEPVMVVHVASCSDPDSMLDFSSRC